MGLTKISTDDVKKLKDKLENIKEEDLNKTSTLDIINKTNKDLMDIFGDPEKYAVTDNESDFKAVKKTLEARRKTLGEKEINDDVVDTLSNIYLELKTVYSDTKINKEIADKKTEQATVEVEKTALEVDVKTITKTIKDLGDKIKTIGDEIEKTEKDKKTKIEAAIKKLEAEQAIEKEAKIKAKIKELTKDREIARNTKPVAIASVEYEKNREKYTEICDKYFKAGMSEPFLVTVDKELATAIIEDEIKEKRENKKEVAKTTIEEETKKSKEKLEKQTEEHKEEIKENKIVLTEKTKTIDETKTKITEIEKEIKKLDSEWSKNDADPKDILTLDAHITSRIAKINTYVDPAHSFSYADYTDIFKDAEKWINSTLIDDIETKIVINPSIKDGKLLKTKLAWMILEMAITNNVNNLAMKWENVAKEQVSIAEENLKNIDTACKQIDIYQKMYDTVKIVEKRLTNLWWLEKTNPKNLPKETVDKWTKKNITIDLKDNFLDTTKLEEVAEWYEISKLKITNIINKEEKEIEIFEDATGKKFEKTIKAGDPAVDIFIKDKTGYIKIGKIEIDKSKPTKLEIEIEAYKDLPGEMEFPIKLEMDTIGIGWKGGKLTDKVAISKKLVLEVGKPDFDAEYTSLDGKYDIKNKLDKIFQEQYMSQLRDRLFEFMATNERTKGEWAKMSSDERTHFFQDTIMSNGNPSRLWAGIYGMISDVNKDNCYGNIAFADDFKKRILEIFTGKSESDLKKLIFEKLGNLDFTDLNPTYAIKVLADKVKENYTTHQEWLYQALNAYLLNVRGWGMKVTPEKLHDGSLAGVKEIKAVVADSKEISREDAYKNALKKIEDEYKSWIKFWFTRAKIFFFREKMLRNLIAKEMKGKGWLSMDDKTNSAVNRRATEKSMGGTFAENIVDVEKDTKEKVFVDPIFQQELDTTVVNYLTSTAADADTTFQTEVEDLINNNSELRNYMKRYNITHLGTNIIEQTKAEKAERNYYTSVISTIDKYTKDGILNKPQEFEVDIRNSLQTFMKQQNKLPDMVKQLGLNIDKVEFATKLATHRTTLETMRNRTVKMRLSLLVNKSEDEKGLTTAQYVNQDKFDVKHAPKFTKRMAKHPRWTTGITALWLVGTGVVGALTMPVIGAAGGASILWYLNFLKKKGHYTQEHKKFEETILAMTPDQREKYLEELKEKSEKRPKFIRRAFPTTYSKYGESMEYLNNVDSVENVTKKIQRYIEKWWVLTAPEKKMFQTYLMDGITLLHQHKDTGRNFMYGKEGSNKIEELHNQLYKIILAGITRYDPLAKDPAKVVTTIMSKIKTSTNVATNIEEQSADAKKMRQMRNKLGIFAGTRSAAIYLGSAYAAGWIKNQVVDGWNHFFWTHEVANNVVATAVPTTPWSSLVLDPAFGPNGDLLKSTIFDGDVTKFNAFVAKVQTIPQGSHSEKLWSIFRDMYGTDTLANAKTHEFFNLFSSQITDMPASAQQELIRLGTNFNLHATPQISNLMTSRWYHGMVTNQADIGNLISRFQADPINHTLNNLPTGWTKETACNVLFCNAQWDQLTDLIFDKASLLTPPPPPPGGDPFPPINLGNNDFLSFWAPTVWNEVNKFNREENA